MGNCGEMGPWWRYHGDHVTGSYWIHETQITPWLWRSQFAMEAMARIEIDGWPGFNYLGLPFWKIVIFHGELLNNQMIIWEIFWRKLKIQMLALGNTTNDHRIGSRSWVTIRVNNWWIIMIETQFYDDQLKDISELLATSPHPYDTDYNALHDTLVFCRCLWKLHSQTAKSIVFPRKNLHFLDAFGFPAHFGKPPLCPGLWGDPSSMPWFS